jgi:transcriptional regulator with XRE-family HTH domain
MNKLMRAMQAKNPIDSTLRNPLEVQVARRILRLRTEKGLTQNALARRCGISAAYLSRVESNEAALTIANLAKVAQALGVPAEALVEEERFLAPLALYRQGSGTARLLRGKGSHAYRTLASGKRGKLMEPLMVEVKDTLSAGRLSRHSGEEFNYLLKGRCTFFYGKEQIQLEAGDAVYYDATILHGVRSVKGVRSQILSIVSSRDYLFHGDISRLLESS